VALVATVHTQFGSVHWKVGCACSEEFKALCGNDRLTYQNEYKLRCSQWKKEGNIYFETWESFISSVSNVSIWINFRFDDKMMLNNHKLRSMQFVFTDLQVLFYGRCEDVLTVPVPLPVSHFIPVPATLSFVSPYGSGLEYLHRSPCVS
jgi:hypothetical protein